MLKRHLGRNGALVLSLSRRETRAGPDVLFRHGTGGQFSGKCATQNCLSLSGKSTQPT
jgi:hypothetical protein